jgi:phosphomannomutase
MLLRLLVKRGRPLSELVAPLARRYVQSEEINIEIHGKDEVMARVEKHYQQAGARLERLDGISVQFDDCWFNVRPSNTEPFLRVRLEAVNREALERRTAELKGFLQSAVQGER